MRKVLLVSCGLVLLATMANSGQLVAETGKLKIVVKGMKSAEGTVKIALNNSLEDYKGREGNEPFRGAVVTVESQHSVVHIFEHIPWGEYAVKLFHDANDNDKLDTNFLGIPKEDYGFSNNVRGRFGPPSFDKAKFEFSSGGQEVEIEVR